MCPSDLSAKKVVFVGRFNFNKLGLSSLAKGLLVKINKAFNTSYVQVFNLTISSSKTFEILGELITNFVMYNDNIVMYSVQYI